MIDTATLSEIKKIIFQFIDKSIDKVFIFGSRATNQARKFSDIDIGIEGEKQIELWKMAEIKDAFEESNLPYKVDVVDFALTSKKFQNIAKKKIIELN